MTGRGSQVLTIRGQRDSGECGERRFAHNVCKVHKMENYGVLLVGGSLAARIGGRRLRTTCVQIDVSLMCVTVFERLRFQF